MKAKYNAWKSHGEAYASGSSPSDGQIRAKERYITIAREVGWTEPGDDASEERKPSGMGIKVSTMRADESPEDTTCVVAASFILR